MNVLPFLDYLIYVSFIFGQTLNIMKGFKQRYQFCSSQGLFWVFAPNFSRNLFINTVIGLQNFFKLPIDCKKMPICTVFSGIKWREEFYYF